jgi:ribosomal protein S27E
MINFSCPGCGDQFEIDDSAAGKSGTCKKCGRSIVVPGAPGPAAIEPASAEELPPSSELPPDVVEVKCPVCHTSSRIGRSGSTECKTCGAWIFGPDFLRARIPSTWDGSATDLLMAVAGWIFRLIAWAAVFLFPIGFLVGITSRDAPDAIAGMFGPVSVFLCAVVAIAILDLRRHFREAEKRLEKKSPRKRLTNSQRRRYSAHRQRSRRT